MTKTQQGVAQRVLSTLNHALDSAIARDGNVIHERCRAEGARHMHAELSAEARRMLAEARKAHTWNSDVISWLEDTLGEALGLDLEGDDS